jgi:peptide subunit release factor 1 (eRF1)
MITREDIRELAQFQTRGDDECALSFYFQPQTPQNKSHREEAILAKDLVRDALRESEKKGKNGPAREDLQKILNIAGTLRGNQARAKAIFACGSRKLWREFDVPPQLPATRLFVNRRFHLRPLATLLGTQSRLAVVVVDRQKARFFDLNLDQLREREGMFHPVPRRGRSDGFGGYDGGHSERSVNDEVLHHFKSVAARLKDMHDKRNFEKLIVGCHETNWHDFEPHLHVYVKRVLLGHFSADVASISEDQIRDHVNEILRQSQEHRRREAVREVLSQARSNGRGVTGLRRVLRSLEMGEVQTLLLSDDYSARVVECTACGHLDAHLVRYCPACGRGTRELEDVCEAIIPLALRRDIELIYVKNDPDFDRVGNIAALLRFRADQNTNSNIGALS